MRKSLETMYLLSRGRCNLGSSLGELVRSLVTPSPTLQFIWHDLMNDVARRYAVYTLVFVLIGAATVVAFPYGIGLMVDGVKEKHENIVLVGFALFIGLKFFDYLSNHFKLVVREEIFQQNFGFTPQHLSGRFWRRTLGKLIAEDTQIDGGGVESVRDRVENTIGNYIFTIIPNFAMAVMAVGACFFANLTLGLIACGYVWLDVQLGLSQNQYMLRKMAPIERRIRRWNRRVREWWIDTPLIKTSGVEDRYIGQVRSEVTRILRPDRTLWQIVFPRWLTARRMIGLVFEALLYGLGAYLTYHGEMDVAAFVLLLFSFERIIICLSNINDIQRQVQRDIAVIDGYRRALTEEPDHHYDQGEPFTDRTVGVRFKEVSLTLGDERERKEILKEVSFTIDPGSSVGIIGPSGAGKSQIINLLVRAFDPTSGTIYINGRPLATLRQSSFLQHVAYVPQDSTVFEGTIGENVELGLIEDVRDHEKIWRALRAAGLHFGGRLTKGLQTPVGYNGLRLSGGQRQRLSIARALRKLYELEGKHGLVICDEATSSLDSMSEAHVLDSLYNGLPTGTTLIQIAHRLATLHSCSKFIFVRPLEECSDGRPQVTVHSSLGELYESDPIFREMCVKQNYLPPQES